MILSGKCLVSCNSTERGVLAFFARPILFATLNTCVSTARTGFLKITEDMTLALFLPTPGRRNNDFKSEGTTPLKSEISINDISERCLALLFGYVHDLINSKISSFPALAIVAASGNFFKSAGVISYTHLTLPT